MHEIHTCDIIGQQIIKPAVPAMLEIINSEMKNNLMQLLSLF